MMKPKRRLILLAAAALVALALTPVPAAETKPPAAVLLLKGAEALETWYLPKMLGLFMAHETGGVSGVAAAGLSRYKLIVVAGDGSQLAGQRERLLAYAHAGGKLVLWLASGTYPPAEFFPSRLALGDKRVTEDTRWILQTIADFITKEQHRKPDGTICRLAYGIARGCNRDWINRSNLRVARKAFEAIKPRVGWDGTVLGVCMGTAMGTDAQYYFSRPQPTQEYEAHLGIGPVLLAGAELIAAEK
jgi:hypothetical protein